MRVNVHAGHCPDGGDGASGACCLIKESTEARKVVKYAKKYLKLAGVTVNDCTCEDQVSANECLKRIVKKCNSHYVDLDVSIHFNAGAARTIDKKVTGSEAYVLSKSGDQEKIAVAKRFLKAMEEFGFKNRGVKVKNLYFLKNTEAPAVLIEVAFVDDPEDVELYKKVGAKAIGKAVAEAVTGGPIYEYYKLKKNLKLRKDPGMDGEIILTLKDSGIVKLTGTAKTVKGIVWAPVQVTVSGDKYEGWMSKKYLDPYEK